MENHLVRKHPRVNLSLPGGQEMALAVQECILGLKKAVELVREQEEIRSSHSAAELARDRATVNNNFAVSQPASETERDPFSGMVTASNFSSSLFHVKYSSPWI